LPEIRWAMKGYQADIDAAQQYTGQIYEERGRAFLALRGQSVSIEKGGKPVVLGSLGNEAELKAAIHPQEWNDYSIVARGNVITQILNGRVMSMLIDDDTANRRMDGLIGIQLHAGEPMKIEMRNIRLRPARAS
jgi:3-keto-disaccharide hydrolase